MQCGRLPNTPFVIATGPTRISIPCSRAPRQATEAEAATGCGPCGYVCGSPHGQSCPATGSSRSTRSKCGFRSQYEMGQSTATPSRVRTSKSDGWNRGTYPAKCVIEPPTPWPELFLPSSTGSAPPMIRLSVQKIG